MITIITGHRSTREKSNKSDLCRLLSINHYRHKNHDSGKNKSKVELLFLLALTTNTKIH